MHPRQMFSPSQPFLQEQEIGEKPLPEMLAELDTDSLKELYDASVPNEQLLSTLQSDCDLTDAFSIILTETGSCGQGVAKNSLSNETRERLRNNIFAKGEIGLPMAKGDNQASSSSTPVPTTDNTSLKVLRRRQQSRQSRLKRKAREESQSRESIELAKEIEQFTIQKRQLQSQILSTQKNIDSLDATLHKVLTENLPTAIPRQINVEPVIHPSYVTPLPLSSACTEPYSLQNVPMTPVGFCVHLPSSVRQDQQSTSHLNMEVTFCPICHSLHTNCSEHLCSQ